MSEMINVLESNYSVTSVPGGEGGYPNTLIFEVGKDTIAGAF